MNCPLCACPKLNLFFADKRRSYLRCSRCYLVMVPPEFHLSPDDEKAEYDKHENDPADLGYRRFLSRCLDPLLSRLKPGTKGLDFGCGPGPAISVMAGERGFQVDNYDPFYADDKAVFKRTYDFITLTEVIEHVADAKALLTRLDGLLKPGGILAVMTKRVLDVDAFSRWHYKNDPTHICFYSEECFHWVAEQWRWRLEVIDRDLVFLTKPRS